MGAYVLCPSSPSLRALSQTCTFGTIPIFRSNLGQNKKANTLGCIDSDPFISVKQINKRKRNKICALLHLLLHLFRLRTRVESGSSGPVLFIFPSSGFFSLLFSYFSISSSLIARFAPNHNINTYGWRNKATLRYPVCVSVSHL